MNDLIQRNPTNNVTIHTDERNSTRYVCYSDADGGVYYSAGNKLTLNFITNNFTDHQGILMSFKTGTLQNKYNYAAS